MNGFIVRTMMAACLAGGLAAAGCAQYREMVDPCYPQRYSHQAREEVKSAFTPQVANGHYLDQTVWIYHFEKTPDGSGTDLLTLGGMRHLSDLARRRPSADPIIYLQTAQLYEDIPYDPAKPDPEKFAKARRDLDARRITAIQKYLAAITAGREMAFQV